MKGVGIIYVGLRQRGGAEVPSPVTDREVEVVDRERERVWSIVEMK